MDYLGYAYSACVALGGVMGYAKQGSVPSLVAGLAFGAVGAFGAHQYSTSPKNYHTGLVVASVLLGVMGSRFLNSGKMMPAGIVTGLSLVMVIRYGSRMFTSS